MRNEDRVIGALTKNSHAKVEVLVRHRVDGDVSIVLRELEWKGRRFAAGQKGVGMPATELDALIELLCDARAQIARGAP